jgi:hypothetical protein
LAPGTFLGGRRHKQVVIEDDGNGIIVEVTGLSYYVVRYSGQVFYEEEDHVGSWDPSFLGVEFHEAEESKQEIRAREQMPPSKKKRRHVFFQPVGGGQLLDVAKEGDAPAPPGPMVEFDEAAVLAWVAAVPGLTAAQRTAALERMEEDEYDGGELAMAKAKSLLRLLRGTAAEGAVSRLLAARDTQLEAEDEEAAAGAQLEEEMAAVAAGAAAVAAAAAAEAAPAERPSCAICMEPYSAAAGVVPRMLVQCGHDFCEACLDRMLRCAGHNRASPWWL